LKQPARLIVYSFLISIKAPAGSLKASLIYTALAMEEKLARGRKKGEKEGGERRGRKKGGERRGPTD
jgi:hypothetical protein